MKDNTISTFLEMLKHKQSPAEPGGIDRNWPLGRRETKQHSKGMSGTKNYVTLSQEQESKHGSIGSRASNMGTNSFKEFVDTKVPTILLLEHAWNVKQAAVFFTH